MTQQKPWPTLGEAALSIADKATEVAASRPHTDLSALRQPRVKQDETRVLQIKSGQIRPANPLRVNLATRTRRNGRS